VKNGIFDENKGMERLLLQKLVEWKAARPMLALEIWYALLGTTPRLLGTFPLLAWISSSATAMRTTLASCPSESSKVRDCPFSGVSSQFSILHSELSV
jgi:hypothetical protein